MRFPVSLSTPLPPSTSCPDIHTLFATNRLLINAHKEEVLYEEEGGRIRIDLCVVTAGRSHTTARCVSPFVLCCFFQGESRQRYSMEQRTIRIQGMNRHGPFETTAGPENIYTT